MCRDIWYFAGGISSEIVSDTKENGRLLGEHCGLSKTGKCDCKKRLGYAIESHRLNPHNLEYSNLESIKNSFTRAMEEMDDLSFIFADLPKYQAPKEIKTFLDNRFPQKV